MNAVHPSIRRRALLALPTAVIVAAAIAAPSVAATPTSAGALEVGTATTVAGPTTQGIIMRDGGVWHYPVDGFGGRGVIGGRSVRCLTVEAQVYCRSGYDPVDPAKHDRDLELLRRLLP